MAAYKDSMLWCRELAPRDGDKFQTHRDRLRVTYGSFWERSVALASRISSDFPGLTLHDETHFVALWDCASLLTGNDYPLNPLETFVLGGAILLHDLGHALAAYGGGLNEVKATTAYKDALFAVLGQDEDDKPTEDQIKSPNEEQHNAALFAAVRNLHAERGETLAKHEFRGQFLIDDQGLRESLAQIIGKIAKSHHLDRHKLADELGNGLGAPPSMPSEWVIDPIKVACILRCADAIQIDERRAPAFQFALQNPQGVSRQHWLAQRLAQPTIDLVGDKPYALKFTSHNDIEEDDAEAWWVAHDLVRVADEELRGCHQLMRAQNCPVLSVDRVAGADSPARLAQFIRPKDWQPISAEVRVTDVEHIIRLFGGDKLYGDDPIVPLRELIQNAADAVRARRAWSKDDNYMGRIDVSLRLEGDGYVLCVEDNGLGMSEAVLTGPLIEFGKSFWKSREAQAEFPGLISANLKQSGRYGIGFFSTLMISPQITVTSRRFDNGHDAARTLSFRNGLHLRPLLSPAKGRQLASSSTRVELNISPEIVDRLLSVNTGAHEPNIVKATLPQLCAHLCPALDCDVFAKGENGIITKAHSKNWFSDDAEKWLRDICYADLRLNEQLDAHLKQMAPFLRVMHDQHGKPVARAAIATDEAHAGVSAIGGLCSGGHHRYVRQFSNRYVGVLDFKPKGPDRIFGERINNSKIAADWATKQSEIINASNMTNLQKYHASINISALSGDPIKISHAIIKRNIVELECIYEILSFGDDILIPVTVERNNNLINIDQIIYRNGLHGIGFNSKEVEFTCNVLEKLSSINESSYFCVPTEIDRFPNSFLGCLERFAQSRGASLKMELLEEAKFAKFMGASSERESIQTGMIIKGPALKLSLVRNSVPVEQ